MASVTKSQPYKPEFTPPPLDVLDAAHNAAMAARRTAKARGGATVTESSAIAQAMASVSIAHELRRIADHLARRDSTPRVVTR